ncbi:MAG: hypothetical protein RBU37_11590 [Myxococcota bacterium]|nr:hypothetical protein [Myxococcota bacterium]
MKHSLFSWLTVLALVLWACDDEPSSPAPEIDAPELDEHDGPDNVLELPDEQDEELAEVDTLPDESDADLPPDEEQLEELSDVDAVDGEEDESVADHDSDVAVAGDCLSMSFNIHGSPQVYLDFSNNTHVTTEPADYDLALLSPAPPPSFALGPNTLGINLGNEQDFLSVTEAPEDGYGDDSGEPVIGESYKTGGSGTTGFIMSENVYLLQLSDGYAKVTVTQAKSGTFELDYYYSSGRELACDFPD